MAEQARDYVLFLLDPAGNGTRFWANVVITGLRDKSGKLVASSKTARRILIVEDNPDAARTLDLLLRGPGARDARRPRRTSEDGTLH